MRSFVPYLSLIALLVALGCSAAAPKTDIEWTFDQPGELQGWKQTNHLGDVKVVDGALTGKAIDWDPFFIGPVFNLPATPWQQVEIRIKSSKPFSGQLYFTNKTEGQYGGFEPSLQNTFRVTGTDWETVVIRPFWQALKKIVMIRIDIAAECEVAIDSVRIVDLAGDGQFSTADAWSFADGAGDWHANGVSQPKQVGQAIQVKVTDGGGTLDSPPLSTPTGDLMWVQVRMKVDQGARAQLRWASDEATGLSSQTFNLRPDGRYHTYNVDVGGSKGWGGKLLMLSLQPSVQVGATAEIESIKLALDPAGAPDLEVLYFGLEDAVNRAGRTSHLTAKVVNYGGETARGVTAQLELPAGLTATPDPREGDNTGLCEFEIPATFRWKLTSTKPMATTAKLRLSGPGAPAGTVDTQLEFTTPFPAPKADYVPVPQPAPTAYQIGSYYFPRWYRPVDWDCIDKVAPIRKPVLGWYDEREPEIVDWQIKWALEHGVSYFLVDWYWDRGNKHLEHWLNEGFAKAKYRSMFQWCIMWANHNAQGSHSDPKDWENVTQDWIDNFFGQPEYLKQDGKPVVWIWSPFGISRDQGGIEGAKKLLDKSREMVKAAGYPGIVFAAMNAGGSEQQAKDLAAMGYELNSSYHWWGDGPSTAKDPMNFSFELVADSSYKTWVEREKVVEAAGMKWLPVADSGWDSRPWHGDRSRVIYGRTVDQWTRVLRDAKKYLDERDEKQLILGPWNEWGEGSYLEPCAEFGFDMLRAIRQVFTTAPDVRTDITPVDLGLGPYDMALTTPTINGQWDFDQDTGGWNAAMGIAKFELVDGAIHLVTGSTDPALSAGGFKLRAAKNGYCAIRLKATGPAEKDSLQLFFATPTRPASEANSVRLEVTCDGQWHTYLLPLKDNPRWRGVIQSLRLDPGSNKDAEYWIDSILFSEEKPAG